MNDFLSIAIVGVALSLIIQIIKTKFGTSSSTTRALTILLAIAFGVGYSLIKDTSYYEAVLGVLASASAVYAILIKPVE